MATDKNARVILGSEVLLREVEGEAFLLNLTTERYFGLDPVGTRILQVLAESPSIQAAQATLADEYDVDPELLQQDIDELIGRLVDNGLVEVTSATRAA